MNKEIKDLFLSVGADVCGISGIERFADAPEGFSPTDIFPACKSVIVFGIALPKGLMEVPSRLVYGRFNYYLEHETDAIALHCAKLIEKDFGALAVPMPSDSPYEYWDAETLTGRGLISMKHAAVNAGLGRLGKNTLLINPEYGNQLVLGAVLTELEIEQDELCGEICISGCRKCIDGCPANAISADGINQLLCRQNTYGKTARGFDTVDCNKCRRNCPMRFGIRSIEK